MVPDDAVVLHRKDLLYPLPTDRERIDPHEQMTPEKVLRLIRNAIYRCPFTDVYIDEDTGAYCEKDCKKAKRILSYIRNHSLPNKDEDYIFFGLDNVNRGLETAHLACLNSSEERPTSCGTAQDTLIRVTTDTKSAIDKMRGNDSNMDPELYTYTHGVMDLSEIGPQIPEIDPSTQKDSNPIGSDILSSMHLAYDEALKLYVDVVDKKDETIDKQKEFINEQKEFINEQNQTIEYISGMVEKVLSATTQMPNQHGDQTIDTIATSVPENKDLQNDS